MLLPIFKRGATGSFVSPTLIVIAFFNLSEFEAAIPKNHEFGRPS
jgi:hypothetical protein